MLEAIWTGNVIDVEQKALLTIDLAENWANVIKNAQSIEMTWEEMKVIEPRLASIELELLAIKDDPSNASFCANRVWYAKGGPKERMMILVGDYAKRAELWGSKNYDTAYEHLYGLLPNCRNCSCFV